MAERKSVRLLRRGDIIQHEGHQDVVREVMIVAHMGNGRTATWIPTDSVINYEPEEISDDLMRRVNALAEE